MRRNGKTKSGFTLVEAMVALFILTIALASAFALMTWMIRANAFSSRMTSAVTLAQDCIEDLLDRRYSEINDGNDAVGIYQRTWTVTADSARKTIVITVRWPNPQGGQHQVQTRTIVDP